MGGWPGCLLGKEVLMKDAFKSQNIIRFSQKNMALSYVDLSVHYFGSDGNISTNIGGIVIECGTEMIGPQGKNSTDFWDPLSSGSSNMLTSVALSGTT